MLRVHYFVIASILFYFRHLPKCTEIIVTFLNRLWIRYELEPLITCIVCTEIIVTFLKLTLDTVWTPFKRSKHVSQTLSNIVGWFWTMFDRINVGFRYHTRNYGVLLITQTKMLNDVG